MKFRYTDFCSTPVKVVPQYAVCNTAVDFARHLSDLRMQWDNPLGVKRVGNELYVYKDMNALIARHLVKGVNYLPEHRAIPPVPFTSDEARKDLAYTVGAIHGTKGTCKLCSLFETKDEKGWEGLHAQHTVDGSFDELMMIYLEEGEWYMMYGHTDCCLIFVKNNGNPALLYDFDLPGAWLPV